MFPQSTERKRLFKSRVYFSFFLSENIFYFFAPRLFFFYLYVLSKDWMQQSDPFWFYYPSGRSVLSLHVPLLLFFRWKINVFFFTVIHLVLHSIA